MKKNSTTVSAARCAQARRLSSIPELTIAIDLSDGSFRFCELNREGEIVAEGQAKLDRATMRRYLVGKPRARVRCAALSCALACCARSAGADYATGGSDGKPFGPLFLLTDTSPLMEDGTFPRAYLLALTVAGRNSRYLM